MRGSKARGVPRSPSMVMAQIRSADSASVSASRSCRPPTESMACVPLTSEMPSLDASTMGWIPARRRASAPGSAGAVELGFAFADEHQRDVGERREIATGADAALRRNDGRDAAIQQIAQALRNDRADAGKTLWRARWRGSASCRALRRERAARPLRRRGSGPRCAAAARVRRAGRERRRAIRRRC